MNEFELYTMIFFAVDAYYEDNPSDELGAFLGMMSPFTFKEVDSADSAVYEKFRKYLNGREVTIENSFSYAKDYLKTVDYCDLNPVFSNTTENEWQDACVDYLSKPHKGQKVE